MSGYIEGKLLEDVFSACAEVKQLMKTCKRSFVEGLSGLWYIQLCSFIFHTCSLQLLTMSYMSYTFLVCSHICSCNVLFVGGVVISQR